jgi:hypothetical protein
MFNNTEMVLQILLVYSALCIFAILQNVEPLTVNCAILTKDLQYVRTVKHASNCLVVGNYTLNMNVETRVPFVCVITYNVVKSTIHRDVPQNVLLVKNVPNCPIAKTYIISIILLQHADSVYAAT